MAQLRSRTDRAVQAEITTLRNDLLFEAQTRAMACRLHAEAALDERLLQLARQLLPELAERGRAALWQALCEELPEADWASIRVRPADQQLASRDFPAATVENDETLGGGLIVTNARRHDPYRQLAELSSPSGLAGSVTAAAGRTAENRWTRMKLLSPTRPAELPAEALLARLRCRRAAIDLAADHGHGNVCHGCDRLGLSTPQPSPAQTPRLRFSICSPCAT